MKGQIGIFDPVHDPENPDWEVPTPIEDVMRLTRPQREKRVTRLVEMAHARYDEALAIHGVDKDIVATCLLYSGGNDSTTIAHLFRPQTTHFLHAHTGTGIQATRDFVAGVADDWGKQLIIERPQPGKGYRDLVLGTIRTAAGDIVWPGGFPSSAAHGLMYQRLKERQLDRARHTLGISNSRTKRALWIAGRRRTESEVRATIPHHEADGSVIWVSPLAVWHKADLRAYRLMCGDVPHNPVTDVLGMSGECGCLANAKNGEADHWKASYPDDPFIQEVIELEELIADRDDIPDRFKRWGNNGDPRLLLLPPEESTGGRLCSDACGADKDPLIDLMDPLFTWDAA